MMTQRRFKKRLKTLAKAPEDTAFDGVRPLFTLSFRTQTVESARAEAERVRLTGAAEARAIEAVGRAEAEKMLGSRLVTEQTGEAGELVEAVYVEAAVEIERDVFVAIVLDPATAMPTLLASAKGGVQFEQMARMDPDVVKSLALTDGADVSGFLSDLGLPRPLGLRGVKGSLLLVFFDARVAGLGFLAGVASVLAGN